jgi:hypothetical protein
VKVAVIAVRVVQVPVHEIVHVIAVWYRGVAAVGTVHVAGIVATALVRGRATGRHRIRNLEGVLMHIARVLMMQMAVVQVVHVVVVLNARVAAARTVNVGVVRVSGHVVLVKDVDGNETLAPPSTCRRE